MWRSKLKSKLEKWWKGWVNSSSITRLTCCVNLVTLLRVILTVSSRTAYFKVLEYGISLGHEAQRAGVRSSHESSASLQSLSTTIEVITNYSNKSYSQSDNSHLPCHDSFDYRSQCYSKTDDNNRIQFTNAYVSCM